MRSESQSSPGVVVFAVLFSMALALCVALFCTASMRGEENESPAGLYSAVLGTPAFPGESADAGETAAQSPLSGLRFSSNGDGTCLLVGVGSCTEEHIVIPESAPSGERVTAIAARAFYACSTVTAVQIPATVTEIGSLAFAACKNLSYISVSPRNPAYRDIDGVLYTSDERILLQYPPLRAGSSFTLRAGTVEIAEMAFYQCAYLKNVAFTGSAEEWEAIAIGAKNYSLTAAAKTFGMFET